MLTGAICACAICCVCCCCLLLQSELVKAQEEAGALREGSSDLASLQAQLAAAQEEASGLRNNSEEVEYLQAQLRRTLRQVVELQRQVRAPLAGEGRGSLGSGLCLGSCDVMQQHVERHAAGIGRVLCAGGGAGGLSVFCHLPVRTGPAAAAGALL